MAKTVNTASISEIQEATWKLCAEYLGGAWNTAVHSDLLFQRITGGLSSEIYRISLPCDVDTVVSEPREVAVRFYGTTSGSPSFKNMTMYTHLSAKNLSAHVYGVFKGGHIEEYMQCRTIKKEEMVNPEMSTCIAKKLAQYHSAKPPLKQEPNFINDIIKRWGNDIRSGDITVIEESKRHLARKVFAMIDLDTEVAWMHSVLKTINSPIVFAHNDFHLGNVVLRLENEELPLEERLVVIDYEYSAFMSRGFDLACLFTLWTFDIDAEDYPHFAYHADLKPSEDVFKKFLSDYLENLDIDCPYPEANTVDHLYKESKVYLTAAYLFLISWALKESFDPKGDFGYFELAELLINMYKDLKVELDLESDGSSHSGSFDDT